MKFIVIGLGNFGSTLGLRLVEDGHEVIGVDENLSIVNLLQDKLTHAICMDATDEMAIQRLPLTDTDVVIISIGEDIGASVTTTALMKKYCNTKIISRAISPVHHTILEAMGIEDIIHPEAEFADQLAKRLIVNGALRALVLDNKFEIIEANLPANLQGKTVADARLREKYGISIVTILKKQERRNILGAKVEHNEVTGVPRPETVFQPNDILVLFGKAQDIQSFLKENTL
ncbi:MAG: TrkA family potassium uptake protein [Lewinellaceae bacterium]|nr:TrkA family potassium uptake protein [Lewinellaceae bacterium]MCB9290682.1 TrkA family potassium uptake protein [Lewinellaceae bacterium]